MKTALITGITGQDGAYLTRHLLDLGYKVVGLMRRSSTPDLTRLEKVGVSAKDIHIEYFDLCEPFGASFILDRHKPDEFYNIGAQTFVAASFDLPLYTFDANAVAVARLMEAIRLQAPQCRIYQASTSEMFGAAPAPQNETTPFHPRSPYGVAKLAAYWFVRNYRESYGLHASNGILFNHESPLRGPEFVTRKITLGLSAWLRGEGDTVMLGNMDAKRDWGHAADYVRAQHLILQQDTPDDYVIATGETHTVREFCTAAAAAAGVEVEWVGEGVNERGLHKRTGNAIFAVSPQFFRPAEVDILLGDATKARTKLGWQPEYDFNGLVEDMMRADYGTPQKRAANG